MQKNASPEAPKELNEQEKIAAAIEDPEVVAAVNILKTKGIL